VLKFGQDYIRRDLQGACVALVRSQFNAGLGLFNATTNAGPVPDGRFFSWLGQVQRMGANNLLLAQAEVQLTPDSLLPSQQFVIGVVRVFVVIGKMLGWAIVVSGYRWKIV
jgi:hemolysin activation/secretion protein